MKMEEHKRDEVRKCYSSQKIISRAGSKLEVEVNTIRSTCLRTDWSRIPDLHHTNDSTNDPEASCLRSPEAACLDYHE